MERSVNSPWDRTAAEKYVADVVDAGGEAGKRRTLFCGKVRNTVIFHASCKCKFVKSLPVYLHMILIQPTANCAHIIAISIKQSYKTAVRDTKKQFILAIKKLNFSGVRGIVPKIIGDVNDIQKIPPIWKESRVILTRLV